MAWTLLVIAAAAGFISLPQAAHALDSISAITQASAEADAEMAELAPARDRLTDSIKRELAKSYPGARIELTGEVRWTFGQKPAQNSAIVSRGETSRGELMFAARDPQAHRESTGYVAFAAWQPARVAIKRVLPGQPLSEDGFKVQEINVAQGQAREFRGVLLEPETSLARLEARQTVLEGQFLVSTAVQRMPDVRRGDQVRINVISNGLALSTQGMAQEPGYMDGQVRVSAGKAKRELVGKLTAGGIVEVKL